MKPIKAQKNQIPNIVIRSASQLGNAVRRLRKLQNMSQIQLAQKTGLTQATISRLEKGLQKAEAGTLLLILAALKTDMVLTLRPKSDPKDDLEALF